MSTLAACRADNFYRPKDYDPENRKKEIEKRRKEGTLKVRKAGAKKCRFEMPFHIRCMECKHMIAKGVRFNALKKRSGRYLGTIIYEFKMPCPNCKNSMTIKTDTKNCEYLLVSGCIKYCVDFDYDSNDVEKIQSPEEGEALNKNAFLKLETKTNDIIKAEVKKPRIQELININEAKFNDFQLNQCLRKNFNKEKYKTKLLQIESKNKGLDLELLPINSDDRDASLIVNFKNKNSNESQLRNKSRDLIKHESIFKNNSIYENKNKEMNKFLNIKHRLDTHNLSLSRNDGGSNNLTGMLKIKKFVNINIKKK